MIRQVLIIVVLILSPFFGLSQLKNITIADTINTDIYINKRKISRAVKKSFRKEFGQKLRIKNPSKNYNSSDIVKNRFSIRRRMIFFTETENLYILYYEHSGIGNHTHCLVSFKDSKEIKLYYIDLGVFVLNYDQVLKALFKDGVEEVTQNSNCSF